MNRWLCGCVVSVVVGGALMAQQPNGPFGSMTFNLANGPPFPIVQTVGRGTTLAFNVSGLPNARFITYGSSGLSGTTFQFQGQFVDLNLSSLFVTFNGFANPAFLLDGTGVFNANFPVGQNLTLNSSAAYQTLVENPAAAGGFSFTAAVRATIVPGLITQNLTMGDDTTSAFSLTPYGLSIPFYSQNYTTFHVCSNGFLNFGATGDTDFTSTPNEFNGGAPRIAAAWCDLNPAVSGTISVVIDQSLSVPTVEVRFINVGEFGVGSPHTFTIRMTTAPVGDIVIFHTPQSGPALFEMICGITPGTNLGLQAQKNLNQMNAGIVLGAANENFFEWFGLTTMPFYTAGFNNPWDLVNITLSFFSFGAGAPGASYGATSFP